MHQLKSMRGNKPKIFDEWDLYSKHSKESDTEIEYSEYIVRSDSKAYNDLDSDTEYELALDDEYPIHYGYMMRRPSLTDLKDIYRLPRDTI